MAIVGGAVIPFWLADRFGLQYAFLLPLLCYVHILLYAWQGSRLRNELPAAA